jgi:hypothetical protein
MRGGGVNKIADLFFTHNVTLPRKPLKLCFGGEKSFS